MLPQKNKGGLVHCAPNAVAAMLTASRSHHALMIFPKIVSQANFDEDREYGVPTANPRNLIPMREKSREDSPSKVAEVFKLI